MRLLIACALALLLNLADLANREGDLTLPLVGKQFLSTTEYSWLYLLLLAIIFVEALLVWRRDLLSGASKEASKGVKTVKQVKDIQSELVTSQQESADLKKQFLDLNERHRDLLAANTRVETALRKAENKLAKQADVLLAERSASTEAELINLLAILQQRGRLVDFAMSDLAPYTDSQIGAAARAVQQGVAGVLQEYFTIQPVAAEPEGKEIKLEAGFDSNCYRLVGQVPPQGASQEPYCGKLLHKGWRVSRVTLPRLLPGSNVNRDLIAPAEVELQK